MALPEIEMNGAGMFIAGGPNGDNGLSGKKLVVDAYGPGVPIGGGAWSGKDFFKVDRLGGMAARRVALESLLASDADEALVTLTYLPGGDRPARVDLLLDGEPSDRVVVPPNFGALESRVLHDLFSVKEPLARGACALGASAAGDALGVARGPKRARLRVGGDWSPHHVTGPGSAVRDTAWRT